MNVFFFEHKVIDKNVFYKNKSFVNVKKIDIKFAAVNIKYIFQKNNVNNENAFEKHLNINFNFDSKN